VILGDRWRFFWFFLFAVAQEEVGMYNFFFECCCIVSNFIVLLHFEMEGIMVAEGT